MQQYQVQVGDNIGLIAKRFGVDPSLVTGFRSGNSNLIFPGENLTINSAGPAMVGGVPVQPQAPVAAPAPVAPAGGPVINNGALVPPNTPPGAPAPAPVAPPVQGTFPKAPDRAQAPVQPAIAPTAPTAAAPLGAPRTFQTPSGVTIDENGQVVQKPVESGLDAILAELANTDPAQADALMNALGYSNAPTQVLQKYGVDGQSLEQGFAMNPSGTLADLVKQVSTMTGLPDITKTITDISKQVEDLQVQRDKDIQVINDNPFTSATTKQQLIQKANDDYDKRIGYRTDRLTLLQNTYQQARQEAQFAVSTAVGIYDKNRQFNQDQLKMYLDQQEKVSSAEGAFNLSPGQVRYKLNPSTGQYEPIASLDAGGKLGNLSKEERTYLNQIQDNARQDPNIKDFPAVRASFETARSAALQQSGAGDIVLMRMIAKITDPTTGVREEEFRTFEAAQSTLARYGIALTSKMWSGDRLTDAGRLALYQQAKDIYTQRLSAYQNSTSFFDKQATDAGLPEGLVMPTYVAPTSSSGSAAGTGGWF